VNIGVRQRFIILVFSGLFATMSLIGGYRYVQENRSLDAAARGQGALHAKLMAELAAPYLLASDYNGLHALVQSFMRLPDVCEVSVVDREGRRIAYAVRPDQPQDRLAIPPVPVALESARLGELRAVVYPADRQSRLAAFAMNTAAEYGFIFLLLAGVLFFAVTRTIVAPLRAAKTALRGMIDRKDFTQRLPAERNDEIGTIARDVNFLVDRLERLVGDVGAVSGRIGAMSPLIADDTREVRVNADAESAAVSHVTSSVSQLSSSLHAIAESTESLSESAEETSSAILEMNASNQEVARHTTELTGAVEEVTASVSEMIASIREVAGHIENLTSAAEETSASAIEIDATVREVARTATESSRVSQQVSAEARDIGVRTIRETMAAITTIKSTVERYSGLVAQLGKRSAEIGAILGVIVEVTERTNLLALNASILAAQAGEYGKGFAVVAGEIKALADRTAGSTQDIATLIAAVKKETKDAVSALSDGLAAVEEGVVRSHEAGAALEKILESSTRSSEMAAVIERAMSEQARGIRQVGDAITNVKQMALQISGATQTHSRGTELILKSAEDMRDIARRVTIAMSEQGRGGQQIAVAADNVTIRAGKIAAGAREQRQAIQQILSAMEQIEDLPRRNSKRMDSLSAAIKSLGEQSALLQQEISAITVRRGRHGTTASALRMGVIPLESPAEMYRRFTPLVEYLSRVLGKRIELSLAVDFSQTLADFEAGSTDLVFLTPTTYLEAKKRCGAVLLAKALRNGVPTLHSVIIARADSGMTRLDELKGKRFAFGDQLSTTSYLMPLFMLTEAGVPLESLKSYAFLGHHDDVARAVLDGEFDAGGVRESTAKTFAERGLSVVKTSASLPEYNICASDKLDRRTADAVKLALINMNRNDAEQAAVLSLIDQDYTGFTTSEDGDYDGVRQIVETMSSLSGPGGSTRIRRADGS
jgi:phosphate/phosphite/phosphonate ABC transporter binding protein